MKVVFLVKDRRKNALVAGAAALNTRARGVMQDFHGAGASCGCHALEDLRIDGANAGRHHPRFPIGRLDRELNRSFRTAAHGEGAHVPNHAHILEARIGCAKDGQSRLGERRRGIGRCNGEERRGKHGCGRGRDSAGEGEGRSSGAAPIRAISGNMESSKCQKRMPTPAAKASERARRFASPPPSACPSGPEIDEAPAMVLPKPRV